MFRRLIGPDVRLAMTVKANAYGHGLLETARAFLGGGADWLSVHSLEDAEILRNAGVTAPVYVMGPIGLTQLDRVAGLDLRMVVYNRETVEGLVQRQIKAKVHIKLETGNNRQGIGPEEALSLAALITQPRSALELEGICSHFANIEDTTDHRFARGQLAKFHGTVARLKDAGYEIPIRHLSNSAATLLWPDQDMEMVRVGVSGYGLWPSKETQIAAALVGRRDIVLRPALHWKTRIAQLKDVPAGESVGYGCSFVTSHPSKIAIIPVGYFDGYDRG